MANHHIYCEPCRPALLGGPEQPTGSQLLPSQAHPQVPCELAVELGITWLVVFGRLSLSEIKYERSDDAGRRGRASLRCSLGCELVASSAHPCPRTGVFGSDCSSSHNSAADGEDGALPKQSRGPNSPVGSNRSPVRNIRSARVSA